MPNMRMTAAAVLLVSMASTAFGEEVIWFGDRNESGASLVYGTPNSGYGQIVFSCEPGQNELVFVYEHKPIDAKDGVKVDVNLSAGDIHVSIPTTGAQLEMDDLFILEGRTTLDERLQDLLTSRGTLIVTIEDGTAEYPLDGAAEAARRLIEACSGG